MFAIRAAVRITEERAPNRCWVGAKSAARMMWLIEWPLRCWIVRVWFKPHRGPMKDDPLPFILRACSCIVAGARFLTVTWAAT